MVNTNQPDEFVSTPDEPDTEGHIAYANEDEPDTEGHIAYANDDEPDTEGHLAL